MTIQEKLYTLEEYKAYAAAHPDQSFELIDGRIVEKVTRKEHSVIALRIGATLLQWVLTNKIKGHAGIEIRHRRPEDKYNERKPDVSFRYTSERVNSATFLLLMPDFAVEIKSKNNSYKELREKAQFYIANGTRLVWLVYPNKQIVEVHYADGSSDLFKETEILDGGDVLPGFQLAVAAIFGLNTD
jgi:Uma2 family endonuclease